MMKLILASASPRRRQILADAGFQFELLGLDVDESFPADMPVLDIPLFLARKKMDAAISMIAGDEVVITADTAVILKDKIINKPVSHADAYSMLKELSGEMHTVVTG